MKLPKLPKLPKSLKSRKLWLSLIAAAVAFANSFFDWGFSNEQVWLVVAPLLAYVGIEGFADSVERFNGK